MRDVTDSEFDSAIANGKVCVDFYGTWCPPCKPLAKLLEALEKENVGITFVKVNVDEQPGSTSRFGITALPTLFLFEDGIEEKQHVGSMSMPALRAWLGV